ncbi:hypothetical protein L7F22_068879 [Adiantum nelumboides]|nr:hypothetical protein [Adiantum nelumboides]
MSKLRSDSILAKQIVRSFLRFLSSVELTPEVDTEAVIVASQCLGDAFKVATPTLQDSSGLDLVQLFKQSGHEGATMEFSYSETIDHKPSTPTEGIAGPSQPFENSLTTHDVAAAGMEDRLFEQFKDGLESAGYFDGLSDGTSKFQELLEKSKLVFAETLKVHCGYCSNNFSASLFSSLDQASQF